MILTPKEFVRFLDGRGKPTAVIGRVPDDLAPFIGARTNEIRLTPDYAHKLIRKHRLKYEQFEMVQVALDFGFAGIHRRADLAFILVDDVIYSRAFFLVVKTAKNGEELWFKTFYRVRPEQVRKVLGEWDLLREHK